MIPIHTPPPIDLDELHLRQAITVWASIILRLAQAEAQPAPEAEPLNPKIGAAEKAA